MVQNSTGRPYVTSRTRETIASNKYTRGKLSVKCKLPMLENVIPLFENYEKGMVLYL